MAKAVKREWSDWLNPVLVKEIRQYFHNFGILAVMGVLLVVQLMMLVVMQYQVSESRSAFSDSGAVHVRTGRRQHGAGGVSVCAFGACCASRASGATGSSISPYITVITPNRIIWGKLLGSLVMIIFIYALCLPFMVIAYFLRGIAMGDMFLVALAMLPPLLVATQAGILVGSAGKRWLIGVFCLAIFFFGQPAALFFAAFLWGLFRGTDSVGAIIFLWCVFCAILLGLLYALSVAAVSSRFSNRMLPVRLFLVGTFVCSPLIGLGVALAGDMTADIGKVMLVSLTAVGSTVAALCATLAAFERLDPGERVRRAAAAQSGRPGLSWSGFKRRLERHPACAPAAGGCRACGVFRVPAGLRHLVRRVFLGFRLLLFPLLCEHCNLGGRELEGSAGVVLLGVHRHRLCGSAAAAERNRHSGRPP